MKNYNLTILLLLFTVLSYAQCNCEKINREDGTIVNQCAAAPISSDEKTEVGLSIATTGTKYYLAIVIRFRGNAIKSNGKTTIRLENNQLFSLDFVSSSLSYIGDYQVSTSIYNITIENRKLLSAFNIKTLSFNMDDNLLHTYQAKRNNDIVKKHLNCLK